MMSEISIYIRRDQLCNLLEPMKPVFGKSITINPAAAATFQRLRLCVIDGQMLLALLTGEKMMAATITRPILIEGCSGESVDFSDGNMPAEHAIWLTGPQMSALISAARSCLSDDLVLRVTPGELHLIEAEALTDSPIMTVHLPSPESRLTLDTAAELWALSRYRRGLTSALWLSAPELRPMKSFCKELGVADWVSMVDSRSPAGLVVGNAELKRRHLGTADEPSFAVFGVAAVWVHESFGYSASGDGMNVLEGIWRPLLARAAMTAPDGSDVVLDELRADREEPLSDERWGYR